MSLELKWSGLGGVQERITAVPVFAGGPEGPDNPGGSPGLYQVEFVFARPSEPLPARRLSVDRDVEGDSHLHFPHEVAAFRLSSHIDERPLGFTVSPNAKGCLARASTEPFMAASFDDAEDAAYRGIASGLSHWATLLDIPIQVGRVYIHELATGVRAVSCEVPFPDVEYAPDAGGALSQEYRLYTSFYREGLSANRPAYQYLCFFKVIEGIRRRRARLDEAAVKAGQTPSREPERIPGTYQELRPWMDALFLLRREWEDYDLRRIVPEEALGRKLGALYEDWKTLRHEIAHALTDEGEPRPVLDEQLVLPAVYKWLPLVRLAARLMIKNEFAEFGGPKKP